MKTKQLALMALAMLTATTTVVPAMAFSMSNEFVDVYVEFEGEFDDADQYYEITAPAIIVPGDSADIKLTGIYSPNTTINITAPDKVNMKCNLDGSTEDLAVTFNDISQAGDVRSEVNATETLTVANMPSDIKLGKWTGTITLSSNVILLGTFSYMGDVYQFESGMTWEEWLESDYNTFYEKYGVEFIVGETGLISEEYNYNTLRYEDGSTVNVIDKIKEITYNQ